MKEQLISFQTAKLAKEKGFQIPCYRHYNNKQELIEHSLVNGSSTDVEFEVDLDDLNENFNYYSDKFNAPTQSLLQKWLREKHKIYVFCTPREFEKGNGRKTIRWNNNFGVAKSKFSSTYEKALEKGLFEALKSI